MSVPSQGKSRLTELKKILSILYELGVAAFSCAMQGLYLSGIGYVAWWLFQSMLKSPFLPPLWTVGVMLLPSAILSVHALVMYSWLDANRPAFKHDPGIAKPVVCGIALLACLFEMYHGMAILSGLKALFFVGFITNSGAMLIQVKRSQNLQALLQEQQHRRQKDQASKVKSVESENLGNAAVEKQSLMTHQYGKHKVGEQKINEVESAGEKAALTSSQNVRAGV